MKINKNLIWIIAGIILLAVVAQQQVNVKPQFLVPQCFEKEDCRVSAKAGYCSANYDCIQGKCYSENVLCAEKCDSGKDEDLDRDIDCNDTDCWNSQLCSCSIMSFNTCLKNRCWCPEGSGPRWYVGGEGEGNSCICI